MAIKNYKKNVSSEILLKKILIVDDEEEILYNLSKAFKKEGWMVNTASDGNVAIELMEKQPYPVALVDIRMPNMNGHGFIEKVNREKINTNVIFMTGSPDYEGLKKGVDEGLFRYVEKPFETKKVIELATEAFLKLRDELEKDSELQAIKNELKRTIKYFKKR